MAEFIARMLVAGAVVGLGALRPEVGMPFAVQCAAIFASASLLLYLLERRDLRPPILSAFAAVLDSFFVGCILAPLGWVDRAGFAVLAPMAWAASRHIAPPALMAPLGAAALLAAQNLYGTGPMGLWHWAAAGLIAVTGLLLPARPRVRTIEVASAAEVMPAREAPIPNDLLEIRESYRAIRDHAAQIERRSRKDRTTAAALSAAFGPEGGFGPLAKALQDASGADGLSLYTVAQYGERMVVKSASGDVPEALESEAFEAPSRLGEGQLRHRIDQLVRTLRTPGSDARTATVILKHQGRVAGMACLFAKSIDAADEAGARIQESAEAIGIILKTLLAREEDARRRHEAEILYAVSTITAGADTRRTLAQRIVREMQAALGVEVLGLVAVQDGVANPLAHVGAALDPMSLLSFGFGQGLTGWLASGAPEVAMHDARSDMRLDPKEAIKRRIGSLMILPVSSGPSPDAYLVAASFRVGGIDVGLLETLRMISAELGHSFSRVGQRSHPSEGLATPVELFKAVQEHDGGCLVYLDILKRTELVDSFGQAAVTHALASFARRIKAMLPAGSLLCRRDEGDYVAFLRDIDERAAVAWANDAAATASLIGVPTPDGRAKMPLALRAKTAFFGGRDEEEPAAKAPRRQKVPA